MQQLTVYACAHMIALKPDELVDAAQRRRIYAPIHAQVVSCDEWPLISPRRLSAVEHLRRKTASRIMTNGRLNRTNGRVISLFSYTRKRSKHRITLIERKTSSTSTITMSFFFLSVSFFFLFFIYLSWVKRSSRRDSIIATLSQLYGRVRVTIVKCESPNDSRYYPAADNEVHYPNAAAGETGFVRHTTMNPGSTCTGIIFARAIHLFSTLTISRWKTKTKQSGRTTEACNKKARDNSW